jgi:hypothetical protein
VSAETETQPQMPANCGLLGRIREISRLERMRGGAGRIRTSNQTIMETSAAAEVAMGKAATQTDKETTQS